MDFASSQITSRGISHICLSYTLIQSDSGIPSFPIALALCGILISVVFIRVGIQKRPNQDIGIGGVFTWKRPKYYFSIDVEESVTGLRRKLKVIKARGRVTPSVNIQGKEFFYDLIGCVRCQLTLQVK